MKYFVVCILSDVARTWDDLLRLNVSTGTGNVTVLRRNLLYDTCLLIVASARPCSSLYTGANKARPGCDFPFPISSCRLGKPLVLFTTFLCSDSRLDHTCIGSNHFRPRRTLDTSRTLRELQEKTC